MIKFKTFSWSIISFAIFIATIDAQAQWAGIKHSLQNDVQIVTETKIRLVLQRQAAGDSLVVTRSPEPDADIYGGFEVKRGGNPYRVWVATERFSNNPQFAGDGGRKFFRATFLKTLRRDEPIANQNLEKFTEKAEDADAAGMPVSGAIRIEKVEAKSLTIENIKNQMAALDSLPSAGNRDSLQVSLSQPAQQKAEKIMEATSGFRNTRQGSAETKKGRQQEKIADMMPPEKTRAELAAAAFSPAFLDSLYLAALAAMKEEDWRQAAFNLEKIQLLQPNYREVVDLLARVRVNLAVAEKPNVEAGPRQTNVPYLFIGGAIASIGAFIALIVLPFIGVVLISPTIRARYHTFRGHYAEAAQIYERLLVRRPSRKKLYPALAGLYLRLGRRDEAALKVYEMTLQLNLADRQRDEINSIVSHNYLTQGRTDPHVIEVLEDALKAERLKQQHGKQ